MIKKIGVHHEAFNGECDDRDFVTPTALFLGLFGSSLMVGLSIGAFGKLFAVASGVLSAFLAYFIVDRSRQSRKNFEWAGRTSRAGSTRRYFVSRREVILFTLLIIAALWLRSYPFPNLQGGQDQGLYVAFGRILEHSKSVNFPDSVRQSLPHDLRSLYDSSKLSSVSLLDASHSTTTIEFYPLHPVFLAIFGWIPGLSGPGYLAFAGAAVVAVGRRLALDLGAERLAANLFSIFLAVNPALVFFSRFPVSETLAMLYLLFGLTMFVRALNNPGRHRIAPALACLACLNSLFYVRLQFFLHLPFFAVVAIGIVLFSKNRETRRAAVVLWTGIVALFGLSLLFYRQQQPGLFFPVWESIVEPLPPPRLLLVLSVAVSLLLFGAALIRKRLAAAYSRVIRHPAATSAIFSFCLIVATVPSLTRLYQDKVLSPWGYPTPEPLDPFQFRYHAIYRLLLFVGPSIFVVGLLHSFFSSKRSKGHVLVTLFVMMTWVGILTRPYVPYLYYYGRYLVVDLLPAFLLLGAIGTAGILKRWRRAGTLFLAFSLGYFAVFTGIQLGHQESEDPIFFEEFSREVTQKDIVVSDTTSQQLFVPLRLIFQRSVFGLPDWPLTAPEKLEAFDRLRRLANKRGGRLLWLSASGENSVANRRPLVSLTFRDSFITNTDHFRGDGLAFPNARSRLLLPLHWRTSETSWSVTDVSDGAYLPECADLSSPSDASFDAPFIFGFSGAEPSGRWTDSTEAGFDCRITKKGIGSLRVVGDGLVTNNQSQRISISINNVVYTSDLLTSGQPRLNRLFNFPPTDVLSVRIKTPDAAMPSEIGLGEDGRTLSLFLKQLEFGNPDGRPAG